MLRSAEVACEELQELRQYFLFICGSKRGHPELSVLIVSKPYAHNLCKLSINSCLGVLLLRSDIAVMLPLPVPQIAKRFIQIIVPVYQRHSFNVKKKYFLYVSLAHDFLFKGKNIRQ